MTAQKRHSMNWITLKDISTRELLSRIGSVSESMSLSAGVDGEVIRHFRRNPPEPIKNVIAIGVYDGHAFLMPSKGVRMRSLPSPFHTSMQPSKAPKHARKEKQESNAQTKESKPHRQLMRGPPIQRILLHGNPFCGLNEKVESGEFISITPYVWARRRGVGSRDPSGRLRL